MSHYPEKDLHITRTGTFILRSDADDQKTAAQITDAKVRVRGVDTFVSTYSDTAGGVVFETTVTVSESVSPGNYEWQQWITVDGNEFPIAGGTMTIGREVGELP